MKTLVSLLLLILSFTSCKSNQKEEKELTIAEKIANAHGFEHWDEVSKIDFTFNIDRDSLHFERTWQWKPKTNDIVLILNSDTISFNRAQIDSTNLHADRKFVNDKYWLLAPFQLIWDQGKTISEPSEVLSPISKSMLNKITLTYSKEGGYTPGDAYDFYFDEDYIIKEWVFRKSNEKDPTMTTTWENYQDFNGLKLATEHRKSEGNWNLNFTNVEVAIED